MARGRLSSSQADTLALQLAVNRARRGALPWVAPFARVMHLLGGKLKLDQLHSTDNSIVVHAVYSCLQNHLGEGAMLRKAAAQRAFDESEDYAEEGFSKHKVGGGHLPANA